MTVVSARYRLFAALFVVAAVAGLLLVAYIVTAKVVITVIPAQQSVAYDFSFTIAPPDKPAEGDAVPGTVRQVSLDASRQFSATGSKPTTIQNAGTVTIVNTTKADQPLVEKTRLASAEDPKTIIARLAQSVVAPAGGRVTVPITLEHPDAQLTGTSTRFIIPGLRQGLWDSIYAETSQSLGVTATTTPVITADDIAQAGPKLQTAARQELLAKAKEGLVEPEKSWPQLLIIQPATVTTDTHAGDVAATFTAKATVSAVAVSFDEQQVIALAKEKIKQNLAADKQLVPLDPKRFSYSVEKSDSTTKTATIRAHIEGGSTLNEHSTILDHDVLVGKSADDIRTYFKQFNEVKSVEITFSPWWLQTTPLLQDKIEVIIGPTAGR